MSHDVKLEINWPNNQAMSPERFVALYGRDSAYAKLLKLILDNHYAQYENNLCSHINHAMALKCERARTWIIHLIIPHSWSTFDFYTFIQRDMVSEILENELDVYQLSPATIKFIDEIIADLLHLFRRYIRMDSPAYLLNLIEKGKIDMDQYQGFIARDTGGLVTDAFKHLISKLSDCFGLSEMMASVQTQYKDIQAQISAGHLATESLEQNSTIQGVKLSVMMEGELVPSYGQVLTDLSQLERCYWMPFSFGYIANPMQG